MLKLYRSTETAREYWEAWHDPAKGAVVIHMGVLGTRGKTAGKRCDAKEADQVIETLAKTARQIGFVEAGEKISLVIQKRLDSWGSKADLAERHRVEDLMNETLGWTGTGMCDGGDIGSGAYNVFCYVVDAQIAATAIVETLQRENLLEGVIIAARDDKSDEYAVLWPQDFKGTFSLL